MQLKFCARYCLSIRFGSDSVSKSGTALCCNAALFIPPSLLDAVMRQQYVAAAHVNLLASALAPTSRAVNVSDRAANNSENSGGAVES